MTRWNDEETKILARRKAELVLQETRFMNQALLRDFFDRTLEAIKRKRKQATYRQLQELIESMSADMDDDVTHDIVTLVTTSLLLRTIL